MENKSMEGKRINCRL